MPIPRPKRGVRWLFGQAATYDLLIAGFASAIGFSSAANYAAQGRALYAWAAGLGTIGVLVFTTCKQGVSLAEARKKVAIHELEGCLHTLHAALDPTALNTPGRLRLAIHVPVGDMLEQVTEYIGDTPKEGRIGRQFPANAGIIGKVFRENDVFVGRRASDDYELYVRELVSDWNYTEQQARRLNPATMTWMGVPFFNTDRNSMEAVLYLDARVRDFFSEERQNLVIAAVNGIAFFIGKRYA